MLQMIFEIFDGQAIPFLPREGNGVPRVPDGQNLFTAEQAEAITGQSAGKLKVLWDRVLSDLLTPPDYDAVVKGDALAAPNGPAKRSSANIARQAMYPNFTDDQYAYFEAFAAEKKLSILAKQIIAEVRRDKPGAGPQVHFITTIDALRSKADETGKYSGQVGPYWCDGSGEWKEVWLGSGYPHAARVGVLRKGFQPMFQVALWSSYAPMDESGKVAPFWHQYPDVMLAKCAEAMAFRKAFPSEFGGLYTSDELARARNGRPAADALVGVVTEDTPPTIFQLHLAMSDMGIKNTESRNTTIEDFKRKWPGLRDNDEAMFCARVFHEVRKNPAAFGAKVG